MSDTTAPRYTAIAVVLHWAIAFAILFNIVLGFWMHISAEHGGVTQAIFQAFQLHKSVGLTVLALSLVRLGWRLTHRPPPLPAHMAAWERIVSKATHWAFYVLMLALPLSGWLYVSAGWSHEQDRAFNVPTLYFGLFQVPHLFGLPEAGEATRSGTAEASFTAHYILAYTAIALVALHVAAALKHHLFDGDEVLAHMVPGLKARNEAAPPPRNPTRLAVLGAGLGLATLAAIALLYAGATLGSAPAPAAAPITTDAASIAPAASAPATPALEPTAPAAPGAPPLWRVDQGASSIQFTGEHSGAAFRGAFGRWRAEIRFDPENLDASSAIVTVQTASAADGVPLHDATLPSAEWFDAANHPQAIFRTTRIRARGDGSYEARGTLTIKGQPLDLELPFTLRIEGDRARMDGHAEIQRREANLGMESDPDADWVSRAIGIDVHVEATRAP